MRVQLGTRLRAVNVPVSDSISTLIANTHPKFKTVHVPQALDKKAIFLRQVERARELCGSFWRTATVLENVVDQGLLVVDVELRGDDMREQGS